MDSQYYNLVPRLFHLGGREMKEPGNEVVNTTLTAYVWSERNAGNWFVSRTSIWRESEIIKLENPQHAVICVPCDVCNEQVLVAWQHLDQGWTRAGAWRFAARSLSTENGFQVGKVSVNLHQPERFSNNRGQCRDFRRIRFWPDNPKHWTRGECVTSDVDLWWKTEKQSSSQGLSRCLHWVLVVRERLERPRHHDAWFKLATHEQVFLTNLLVLVFSCACNTSFPWQVLLVHVNSARTRFPSTGIEIGFSRHMSYWNSYTLVTSAVRKSKGKLALVAQPAFELARSDMNDWEKPNHLQETIIGDVRMTRVLLLVVAFLQSLQLLKEQIDLQRGRREQRLLPTFDKRDVVLVVDWRIQTE